LQLDISLFDNVSIMPKPINKRLILAILILASAVAIMSTDLYAPSLAHLPGYFGTSPEYVKLTMSLNALAYALATLIHGPLSERFGRRPVLLGGIAAFTVFSLLCGMSQTIGQLITARVLQGCTAAVEGVLVLSIIRDVFAERDQVRAIAVYGVATALTPAAAPILGGYVHIFFGWRMNFFILTAAAATATFLIWNYLEESTKKDLNALSPWQIIGDYSGLLRNPDFVRYNIIGGGTLGFFFAFITAGPFILITQHGLPTQYFGYFQGLAILSYVSGSYLAVRLASRLAPDTIMLIGLCITVTGALLLVLFVFGGMETPATLAIAVALTAFGDGPVFASTPSLAMNATSIRTGASAALVVAMEMGISALAALSVAVFHDGTSRPLALTSLALAIMIVIAFASGRKKAVGATRSGE